MSKRQSARDADEPAMLARLFNATEIPNGNGAVICWWEIRRIPYNLLVGISGFACIFALEAIGNAVLKPGEDAVEPLVLLLGVFLYAVACNLCYTFGWICEITLFSHARDAGVVFRTRAFSLGLLLSCAAPTVPLLLFVIAWFLHEPLR